MLWRAEMDVFSFGKKSNEIRRLNFDEANARLVTVKIKHIDEIQFDSYEVRSSADEAYEGLSGLTQAGHTVVLSAETTQFHVGDDRRIPLGVDGIVGVSWQVTIEINASLRSELCRPGSIVGGRVEHKQLKIEISVDPWIVRDIIDVLERRPGQSVLVAGFALQSRSKTFKDVFAATAFTMSFEESHRIVPPKPSWDSWSENP